MKTTEHNQPLSADCRPAHSLLSDYVDNTLSARQALEVEKHLSVCPECALLTRELRAMVNLLHISERSDTSDDFMAKLHARLDGLEPEAARPRFSVAAVRDWFAGLRVSLRAIHVPALSMGVAGTALIAFLVFQRAPQPDATVKVVPVVTDTLTEETLHRNVALAASNPFEDPAAANLAAHAALKENSVATETTVP